MGNKYYINYYDGNRLVTQETADNWFTAIMILWINKPSKTYYWRSLEVR